MHVLMPAHGEPVEAGGSELVRHKVAEVHAVIKKREDGGSDKLQIKEHTLHHRHLLDPNDFVYEPCLAWKLLE